MVRSIPVMRNAPPSRKASHRCAEGLLWRIKLASPHIGGPPSQEDRHRRGVNSQNDLPLKRSFRGFWHQPPLARNPSDPPPLKWSDLRYVSDIEEDGNGKEALQA